MGIGLGIFLIVVGGILAFAVRDSVDAIDLTTVGYICLGAGVIAVLIGIVMMSQRSNTSHREIIENHGGTQPAVPVQPVAQAPVQAAPPAQPAAGQSGAQQAPSSQPPGQPPVA